MVNKLMVKQSELLDVEDKEGTAWADSNVTSSSAVVAPLMGADLVGKALG